MYSLVIFNYQERRKGARKGKSDKEPRRLLTTRRLGETKAPKLSSVGGRKEEGT